MASLLALPEQPRAPKLLPPIPCAFVMVTWKTYVLMGLRCGTVAPGIWGWPGGKADRAGTMAYNAAAELREETGIWAHPGALERIYAVDEWIDAATGQSYPAMFFHLEVTASQASGAYVREPTKHSEWRWFAPDELPESMFEAERRIIEHGWSV